MNKKLLMLGIVAVAGFFVFSAFDGKTLEQQKAEIAQMVTMKLDEIRMQKDQECSEKVNMEAQRRFDEILAQRAADEAAGKKPAKASKPKTKSATGGKGPAVDPLPQPAPAPTDPKKSKIEGAPNTQEKADKMQGAPPNTDKKKAKMQGGGGK